MAAFRLRRHHLDRRVARSQLVQAAGDMGGAQAQLVSAAGMSLWARVEGLEPADVEAALWRTRSLVKVGCMRRTLYLVPAREVSTFVRGTAARAEKEVRWILNRGMAPGTLNRILSAAVEALDAPRTRDELAQATARALGLSTSTRSGGGWGNSRPVPCVQLGGGEHLPADYLLHLAAARDVVCSGPTRDGEATFVRADRWVKGWHDASQADCEDDLLRRYLAAFGPATVDDFRAWTSMRLRDAALVWQRLESELAPVRVGDWDAWLLKEDLAHLTSGESGVGSVRLLPYFDGYLLGHDSRSHLLSREEHTRVYRPAGWVAPSVLVEGRVKGVWSHAVKAGLLAVRVSPFRRLPAEAVRGLTAEAADFARFLGARSHGLQFDRPG